MHIGGKGMGAHQAVLDQALCAVRIKPPRAYNDQRPHIVYLVCSILGLMRYLISVEGCESLNVCFSRPGHNFCFRRVADIDAADWQYAISTEG